MPSSIVSSSLATVVNLVMLIVFDLIDANFRKRKLPKLMSLVWHFLAYEKRRIERV